MVVLFSTVGVLSGHALALSVLFGLTGIVVSLPGLALWLGGGFKRADILQAEVEIGRQREKSLILERMRKVAVARINSACTSGI
jgi:hypothetical protein